MKTYLLKMLATWLADNNKNIVQAVMDAINKADAKFNSGSEKFKFVRAIAIPLLTGKAGWIVDTVIQLLLAYIRKGQMK